MSKKHISATVLTAIVIASCLFMQASRHSRTQITSIQPLLKLHFHLVDGRRRPVAQNLSTSLFIYDAYDQLVSFKTVIGPTASITVPALNLGTSEYRVEAVSETFRTTKYSPIRPRPGQSTTFWLMLLPKKYHFDFSSADWHSLKSDHPELSQLFASGADDDAQAQQRYEKLTTDDPEALACLLNIATALSQAQLPAGSALSQVRALNWDRQSEKGMRRDHLIAYAKPELVKQLARAAKTGTWSWEPLFRWFHHGAIASLKQKQFEVADLHVSVFPEHKNIDGVDYQEIEVHIDYFQSLPLHTVNEVIPERFFNWTTNPAVVYQLRWMAGQNAHQKEFAPPYVIVANDTGMDDSVRKKGRD